LTVEQDYLPEDYKGKGEPSFSIERALKEHKAQKKANGASGLGDGAGKADASGIEMEGGPVDDVGIRRSGSKRASLDGLKRRLGSLRRKKEAAAA
jgi:hypothetical protein